MSPKTAHIIGLGLSGLSAAKLLISEGWNLIGSDDSEDLDNSSLVMELERDGMEFYLHGHDKALNQLVDLVIVSPGVPPHSSVISTRISQGVEIIGEVELGWRHCNGKLVAITGSNGKSTTTALLGEMFAHSDQPSFICGNIGLPICDIAQQTTPDSLIAMEVSSYQLMSIVNFKPDVSVLLGISPDHLEYHGSFENYIAAKSRIFMNQSSSDYLVYSSDDEVVNSLVEKVNPQKVGFSIIPESKNIDQNRLYTGLNRDVNVKVNINDYQLPGKHNQRNALAAMISALLIGVSPENIERGIRTFNGLPHRLEMVKEIEDVIYYNDSKATNPESTLCALEAMVRPTVLIAGGQSKGGGFRMMRKIVSEKVTNLILIGECADEIEADVGDSCPVHNIGRLQESVALAAKLAKSGDAVLLSPMAASFDMFVNFEERGAIFKELVRKLSLRNVNHNLG